MNILMTSTLSYPSVGGAQLHWHKIETILASDGHNVRVLTQGIRNRKDWLFGTTLGAPRKAVCFEADGIVTDLIAPPISTRLAMAPFVAGYHIVPEICSPALAHFFASRIQPAADGCDLIHNIRIGRDYFSWTSYLAARRAGIPFFITLNISARMASWLGKIAVRRLFKLVRSADGVFVFTDEEKHVLVDMGADPDRIEVIGVGPLVDNQPDVAAFYEQYHISGPVIMFAGQKYEYKGYRQLLEAAPKVWQRHPNAQFLFIGPQYGKSAERLANAASDDKRIIDAGVVSQAVKSAAFAACTIFCLPSQQEAFGGVYTEAWFFGKPVIGCDVKFVRSVIENGRDGILVNQNSEEIAEAINYLLEHPNIAGAMGRAGKEKVATRYNWNSISIQVENRYATCLQPPWGESPSPIERN